jgi:TatD DNase family protein
MFIDSHAHLADSAFDADRAEVILRAVDAGAERIVCIGESLAAAVKAQELAAAHPRLLAFTAGVHPHDASSFVAARDVPMIESLLDAGARAVGECGLDYLYDRSRRDAQRAAFRAQLELAARREVPVVVHTREAEADTRSMIEDSARAGVVGVLHCFTGSAELATAAIEAGWSISFSGIITFTKWTDDALLALVPDDRLLVESDAPYLAPVPERGRRNEPAFIPHTIARLAEARGVSRDRIASLTTDNARRFFSLR